MVSSVPKKLTVAEVSGEHPLAHLVSLSLWVLTLGTMIALMFTTLTLKDAAPVDESQAARNVAAAYPYLLQMAAVAGATAFAAVCVLAVGQTRQGRRGRALILAATATAVAGGSALPVWATSTGVTVRQVPSAESLGGMLSITAVTLAAMLWAMRCWHAQQAIFGSGPFAQADRRIVNCLTGSRWTDMLKAMPMILLSAQVTSIIACLPAVLVGLNRADDFGAGLWSAARLSLSAIGLFAVGLCLTIHLVRAALMASARAGWLTGRASTCIGILSAAGAFGYFWAGVNLSFADELRALGIAPLVTATLLILATFYGVGLSGQVLHLCRRSPRPRKAEELFQAIVLAGVLWPVLAILRALARRVRPSLAWRIGGAAVLTILLAVLGRALFPAVEDFLDRIQFLLVVLIVLLAVLAGTLLTPLPAVRWKSTLALLAVLLAASLAPVFGSQKAMDPSRPRVFRYDPLGKYSLTVLESVVTGDNRASMGEAPPEPAVAPMARPELLTKLRRARPLTIVVLADACRPDHMSLYGYERESEPKLSTTPNLDAHADELVRFTRAFSQATATNCSLRHMFTGRYSSRWMLKTKGIAPFWTNRLLAAGYDTLHLNVIASDYNGLSVKAYYRDMPPEQKDRLAVFDCGRCPPDNRFALEGKETHDAELPQQVATPESLAAAGDRPKIIECNRRTESEAIDDLLAFLDGRVETRGTGVFAFVHMMATHIPWQRYEQVEDFGDAPVNRYDQTVRYSDYEIGRLIAGLKARGMWDETMLVIIGDHGTGLNEHGVFGGFHPWFEQVHIPLIMKIPGVTGREVDSLVGLFDLGPTLMEVFDPSAAETMEGRSLWPAIVGPAPGPGRVLFGLNAFADCYYLVTDDGWHYIRDRGDRYEQLYNWHDDPAETRDRIADSPDARHRCRAHMDWFLNDHGHGHGRSYNNPRHYSAAY